MTEEINNTAPANTQNPVDIRDLQIVVGAIDIASKAGAFVGQDMELVGGARNRLNAAVEVASPKQEAPAEAETPVVDAEVVEEDKG